jgi:hypothetical protein
MTRTRVLLALVLVLVAAGVGGWAFWNYEARWWPKTVTRHQIQIVRILESSGWASPGLPGKRLYMVSFRDCPDCARYATEEFPKLHAKGVDTRVIEIARRDLNGARRSTPAERATVAQLWLTHDWKLLQAWEAAPPDAWNARGVPPADGDMARTAVIEAGRKLVDDLTPLMKDNGVRFAYPLLVWWDDKGRMRACACDKPQTYRFVRRELGL